MNDGGQRSGARQSEEFLHARAEVSTGVGPFYRRTRRAVDRPVARCDCLACRDQQWTRRNFQREST
jgi:hypothetical protein